MWVCVWVCVRLSAHEEFCLPHSRVCVYVRLCAHEEFCLPYSRVCVCVCKAAYTWGILTTSPGFDFLFNLCFYDHLQKLEDPWSFPLLVLERGHPLGDSFQTQGVYHSILRDYLGALTRNCCSWLLSFPAQGFALQLSNIHRCSHSGLEGEAQPLSFCQTMSSDR